MQRKFGEVGENESWEGNFPELKFLFHEGKSHGLGDTKIMRDLRDLVKPALLILPDASGTKEQYKALNDLDIEIVVLDHHDMIEKGDNDKVIVVNNQQSEKYQNKQLSGAGIVWQLCRVFDDIFQLACADNFLDLVALGLVSDVMDLRSKETRFLVQEGLKPENIRNAFLQACLFQNDRVFNGKFSPVKIGFNVGPMFNAVSRIGPMSENELLFQALLDSNAEALIESGKRGEVGTLVPYTIEAIRVANNARGRQNTRKTKVTKLIDEVIQDEELFNNKIIFICLDNGDFKEEYRSLSGLIANELMDYYQRPVMILFETDKGDYTGSARVPDNIPAFLNFKQQCNDSGLFTFAEGHGEAHGVGCKKENVDKILEYFNNRYSNIDTTPTVNVDFYLDAEDPSLPDIIREIAEYDQLWGKGLDEPTIAIKNVKISIGTTKLVGQQKGKYTLKITLPNDVEAIKFRSSQEEFDSLMLPYDGVEQCYMATLIGKASINEFRGISTPQIVIESYDIGKVEYVF